MLKFEAFNLPADGQTRVVQVDHYTESGLLHDGWTMVGLAEASDGVEDGAAKLFGVYRRVESEALRAALASTAAAETAATDAKSKASSLERQLADTTKRLAELQGRVANADAMSAVIAAARERFGAAFEELLAQRAVQD